MGEAGFTAGGAAVFRGSGRGSGRVEVDATGEGLRGRLRIRALGRVDGFSGAFSKHGRVRKFPKIGKREVRTDFW